tara:strand:- start:91 stop:987 length:897 start_codon:yes stop_codon:yes gene_type:complete
MTEYYESLIDNYMKHLNIDRDINTSDQEPVVEPVVDPQKYNHEKELYLSGYTRINYRAMENAIDEYNLEKFMVLFDNGLDPNGYQGELATPLIYLLLIISNRNYYSNNVDILKYIDFFDVLFESGADINKSDGRGNIPILYIAFNDTIPFEIFQLLLYNPDLILNEEIVQKMINHLDRTIQMIPERLNISEATKKNKIDVLKLKKSEIFKITGLPIAQQNLATVKGYEDKNSILSHMNPDLMENVSKHLSAMKLSPSVKKRIREQQGSGKRKSKRSKKRGKKRGKKRKTKKKSRGKKK